MAIVVDFQGFKTLDNKFVIKEFAVARLDNETTVHLLLKSPQPYGTLCDIMKRRVKFMTYHVHGLPWDSGTFEFDYIREFMEEIMTTDVDIVFVKGSERTNYIKNWLDGKVKVINMDDFVYSTIVFGADECADHVMNCGRCALTKAIGYKYWLLEHGYQNIYHYT